LLNLLPVFDVLQAIHVKRIFLNIGVHFSVDTSLFKSINFDYFFFFLSDVEVVHPHGRKITLRLNDSKYRHGDHIDDRYESVIFQEHIGLFRTFISRAFFKLKVGRPLACVHYFIHNLSTINVNSQKHLSAITCNQYVIRSNLNSSSYCVFR
jgi:hypothetical protein